MFGLVISKSINAQLRHSHLLVLRADLPVFPSRMVDIFEQTKRDGNYTEMEYAEGLFFKRGLSNATIRIQAPSIAAVFTQTNGPSLGSGIPSKAKPL